MAAAENGNPRSLVIFSFLFLLYALRFFLIGHLQLAPDEACYWYWAKNPDLSYLDHPPMVAYIMALFTWLGGDSEFAVRVGGLLCTLISHVFLYGTVKRLSGGDGGLAWELLLVFNLTLLFAGGCIIQTPDTPLLLFWAIALYGCTQVTTGGGTGWWYLVGVALGLGLLSKYTMALMIPCVIAFLLSSPPHRHWLSRKEPYLATLLGALIFSPVIVWNLKHQWVSLAFHQAQAFSPVEASAFSKLLEYVGGQMGVITPFLFLAFLYYSAWGWVFARQRRVSEYFYLAILSWPILIFFGASTVSGEPAEPNWPAPAYVAGLPLMWIVYRRHFQERRGHRRFMQVAVGLALIVNLIIYAHLVKPVVPLPRGMDPTWQLYGWRELGEKVESHIREHPWESGYFLVSIGAPTVAEVVFYTNHRYTGLDFTRPAHYTFLRDIDTLKGKNAIILVLDLNDSTLDKVKPHFEEVTVLGRNRHFYRGEPQGRLGFYILLGRAFRGNWRPSI
jgi:4-amino-4-deoxy-L-arabinose transferase-like glycosyltransferase